MEEAQFEINQYHILSKLGEGGYSKVYLARNQDNDQLVALKVAKYTM